DDEMLEWREMLWQEEMEARLAKMDEEVRRARASVRVLPPRTRSRTPPRLRSASASGWRTRRP
ncbi:MAG: hypothetical protein ACK4ZJ_16010, partial [Allorhizobium sp.]